MKILEKEIEFNFFDAEEMEKWDKYTEEMKNTINKLDVKNMKQYEFIRKFCMSVEKCFDGIFGEGVAKEIFRGKQDFKLCVKAYKDLVQARKEQDRELSDEMKDIQFELEEINKDYSANRATRRHKK